MGVHHPRRVRPGRLPHLAPQQRRWRHHGLLWWLWRIHALLWGIGLEVAHRTARVYRFVWRFPNLIIAPSLLVVLLVLALHAEP